MESMREKFNESHKNRRSNDKGVWSIVENDYQDKPRWMLIGRAFVNRDNSLNVVLDGTPKSFKLHIRDFETPEDGSI